MANLKIQVKEIIRDLPYPVGRFVSYIPFEMVFGKSFKKFEEEINVFSNYNDEQKKTYSFRKMKHIVSYAYQNITFYTNFYKSNNFHPDELNGFEDIRRIPVVTKDDLIQFKFEERSDSGQAADKINTGGTTGNPLEFYIENGALAREWAHLLHIWSKVGYKRTDLKLNFRGRNIGNKAYKYNSVGNEYIVNAYTDTKQLAKALDSLVKQKTIWYLHGYPSAIYEFARYIEQNKPDLLGQLNQTLKGVLMGSEYPAPVYRDVIDRVFSCPSISWYGHSEMCILAYEKSEQFKYEPMGSYGYCEALPDDSGSFRLIGTSFYNTASPFIRYDTGDLIKPIDYQSGLLKSFKIEKGRTGEFIVDRKGHRISLTSLIFGRHHPIFGQAKFIQVYQPKEGEAIILITKANTGELTSKKVRDNFDVSNVDMGFSFQIIDEPRRTQSGKVPLLVKS